MTHSVFTSETFLMKCSNEMVMFSVEVKLPGVVFYDLSS